MSLKPQLTQPLPPWDSATGDVFLLRRILWDEDDRMSAHPLVCCSIPQELWLWPGVYFGWGPQRREGATLALGILNKLIAAAPGQVCTDWHGPLVCHPDAVMLAPGFREHFLAAVPFWGGRLAGHDMRAWIVAELGRRGRGSVDLADIPLRDLYPQWEA